MSAQLKEESCLLELEGRTLAKRFAVQRRFRCGSFAELFHARNLSPRPGEPADVVIKALNVRLQGELGADLERTLIENIEREARALKQCQHPHLIRLWDCGAALDNAGRQFYYLVLEYLPGGNLARLLQTRRLTLAETLALLQQVSGALECLHSHGLVHRDVKPANIMLSTNHRVATLIDLGTVRWLDDDSGLITEVGTEVYAAPEHYSRSRLARTSLTSQADVYALAKTTYTMLSGEQPSQFKQSPISSLPQSIAREPWARPVLRVLAKATKDNPSERHQSVQEFCAELIESTEATSYTSRPSRPSERSEPARSRLVVDLTPLPTEPSRLAQGLNWLCIRLLVFVRLLPQRMHRLGVFAVVHGASLGRFIRALQWRRIGAVAAIAILCVVTLRVGPALIESAGRFLPKRSVVVDSNRRAIDPSRFKASTDINIRQEPTRSSPKIGLVERDSSVRLLRQSQNRFWCEVEIVQHGRAKDDPTGSDRGWVSCPYLDPTE